MVRRVGHGTLVEEMAPGTLAMQTGGMNSATPPSLPNGEIKALEAALAAPPDNVDLCGKVRAPLEERLQHARRKRRETANPWINVSRDVEAPFNALPRQSRLRLHSNKRHKRRSKKPKRTNLVFEKKELEKQALSQTAQHAHRPHPARQHHSALR